MSFNVYPVQGATLVSPSGTITNTKPTYTWNAVAEATSYQLEVKDCSGTKIQQWYTAAQAGCASTGTCSVTPDTEVLGSSQWLIRTNSYAGYGPWSNALSFSAPIILPTGQSYWSGTWVSGDSIDSGGLYGLITRNGNTLSAQFTVVDPEVGHQPFSASGTVSGNNFTLSGTFDLLPVTITISGSLTSGCVATGTYTLTGPGAVETGQFTLYKVW
jgi:hypothetical protein